MVYNLAWLTDIHLNFIRLPEAPKAFGEYLAKEVQLDSVVISGDISESPTLQDHLKWFSEGLGKPVHFVLGNHDFYRSSIRTTLKRASNIPNWLTRKGVVELTPKVALVGHEGWYDAILGDPYSDFSMSDWESIKEYRRQFRQRDRQGVIRLSRDLSLAAVRAFKPILESALEKYSLVIMVTHVPPFELSSFYQLKVSPPKTRPWYTSKMMGDLLLEVMSQRPDKRLLVLCGHTHHSATYMPLRNLHVLTGHATYHAPDMAGLIQLNDSHVSVLMKFETGWNPVRPFRI